MNHQQIVTQLEANKTVFQQMLDGKLQKEYLYKPTLDKWCMLEVLCHLVDEEKEDFRTRIEYVLRDPGQQLPAIQPKEWVTSRNYIGQNFRAKLLEFSNERTKSVGCLRDLENPAWQNSYQHPKLGPMSAEFFLANWLAHDLIHIRQINRLSYEYLQQHALVNLDYAGNW